MIPVNAQDFDSRLQAVFIYGIARKIEWPQSSEKFKIGVVGNNSGLYSELGKLAASKKIYSRTIHVEKVDLGSAVTYDILFISKNKQEELATVLTSGAENTLIVTAFGEAIRAGSHVNFIHDGNKIAFELNKSAVATTALKISDEIVRLAKLVR